MKSKPEIQQNDENKMATLAKQVEATVMAAEPETQPETETEPAPKQEEKSRGKSPTAEQSPVSASLSVSIQESSPQKNISEQSTLKNQIEDDDLPRPKQKVIFVLYF